MLDRELSPGTLQRRLSRHGLTMLTVVAVALLIGLVPQIRNPIFQIPEDAWQWLRLVVLTTLYVTWLAACWFRFLRPESDGLPESQSVFQRIGDVSLNWLGWLVTAAKPLSRGVAGYAVPMVLIGLSWWVMSSWMISDAAMTWLTPWRMGDGFVRVVASAVLSANVWLLFGKWFDPDQVTAVASTPIQFDRGAGAFGEGRFVANATAQRHRQVWWKAGQVIAVSVVAIVIGELVWILASFPGSGISQGQYSTWAFFSLAFGGMTLAALVDYLNWHTRWPWRIIAVVIVLGLLSLGRATEVSRLPAERLVEIIDRLDVSPGYRVTEPGLAPKRLTLVPPDFWDTWQTRLNATEGGPAVFIAASGGGSRAALFTALVLKELAATKLAETKLAETKRVGRSVLDQVVGVSGISGGAIAAADAWFLRATGRTDHALLTQRMSLDFMAPVYRGVLVPHQSRGQTLAKFWDEGLGWKGTSQIVDSTTMPWLLWIGATDIDRGRRVVISYPPLPVDLLPAQAAKKTRDRVYDPYSLSALNGDVTLPLSEAVRLSASFPWGFRVSTLPHDSGTLSLLDGGLVDNTGLDTVHAILAAIDDRADASAKRVWQRLVDRGVLLIEIDSGAKPRPAGGVGVIKSLLQPAAALTAAAHATALRDRQGYIDDLARRLNRDGKSDRWAHLRITHDRDPDQNDGVMTALALGPRDKRVVVEQFKADRDRWRRKLRELLGH